VDVPYFGEGGGIKIVASWKGLLGLRYDLRSRCGAHPARNGIALRRGLLAADKPGRASQARLVKLYGPQPGYVESRASSSGSVESFRLRFLDFGFFW